MSTELFSTLPYKGGEFLLVTSDERVKESLLYYLNARKVK